MPSTPYGVNRLILNNKALKGGDVLGRYNQAVTGNPNETAAKLVKQAIPIKNKPKLK